MSHTTWTAPATQRFAATPRKYSQLPKLFRWFSEHCVLRSPEESDVMHIWNAATHPHYAHCWTGPVPRSLDDVAQRVDRALSDWNRGSRYALAVQRKSTQEFVGWIEFTAHASDRGAWLAQWFVHPRYVADDIGLEAISAALDLMFNTLDARTLYASCPPTYAHFVQWLNDTGFIEIAAAGGVDATTGRTRAAGMFELGRTAWTQMQPAPQVERRAGSFAPTTIDGAITSGLRRELTLV